MTKLKAIAFGLLLTICSLIAFAQEQKLPINEPDYNKPQLFADLPQKMILKMSSIETLFQLSVGMRVSAQLCEGFNLKGNVVSKSDGKDETVKSIVIRSTERLGATLTFTKITLQGGTITYLGRIMSTNHSDAFEMILEKGQYILLKKNIYDMISE